MRWTRQRFARDGLRGGFYESVSGQQRADEGCCSVRRSRVVLTPRRWRQVRGWQVGPTGCRLAISAGDGGKQARSPGRARRKPLKPLRAGMPGDFRCARCYSCAYYHYKCTRGRGCSGHPAFPTPSLGGEINATPRAPRAARTKSYLELERGRLSIESAR